MEINTSINTAIPACRCAVGNAGRWAGAGSAGLGIALASLGDWPGFFMGLALAVAGSVRWLWKDILEIDNGGYRLVRGWLWRIDERRGSINGLCLYCRRRQDECGFAWYSVELRPKDRSWPALTLGQYSALPSALAAARRWTRRLGLRLAFPLGL